jgi:hypothetical protein
VAWGAPEGTEVIEANLNGQPGLLAVYRASAVSAVVPGVAEGQVNGVLVMANPDGQGRERSPDPAPRGKGPAGENGGS